MRKLWRAWQTLMRLTDASVSDVRVIYVGPSDVFLIEVSHMISHELAQRITTQLKTMWPNHDVMVMDESMKLRVVTRSQADAVAARLTRANGVA